MNFQSRTSEDLDINITPLIDVVFLLLIFFMVSTTFERESEINITLPQASEEITEAKPDAINVAIDARGNIFVNDQALLNTQLSSIKEAIFDKLGQRSDAPVIISADSETDHQSVVKVMDAARQLGLVRITFATQKYDEEEN
ncbi:MAG: biopolymer transporter ExbD [Gammaproteobacteria bacterium]|nr:biopolymer transporter ExbD [Gammaproteobacteria bacterium]